jgi:hypothetical protein
VEAESSLPGSQESAVSPYHEPINALHAPPIPLRLILSRDKMTIDGVWIGNQFIELLQLVTTTKDYALTVLHTSQITVGHTRSS